MAEAKKPSPTDRKVCQQELCSYWAKCPFKHDLPKCRRHGPELIEV